MLWYRLVVSLAMESHNFKGIYCSVYFPVFAVHKGRIFLAQASSSPKRSSIDLADLGHPTWLAMKQRLEIPAFKREEVSDIPQRLRDFT
jgi:hypothetical protein